MKSNGQHNSSSIQHTLTTAGFENVAVLQTESGLFVTYENNIFRNQAQALAKVIQTISDHSLNINIDTISLLVSYHKIPAVAMTIPGDVMSFYFKGQLTTDQFISSVTITMNTDPLVKIVEDLHKQNNNCFKLDIPIGLNMRYLLGAFDYPVRLAFDVVPSLNMEIGKGLGVAAQFALPIYNDLDRNNFIRPGIINIHKDYILPGNIFANFAAGFFSRNRFGIHSIAKKYFLEETFSMGTEFGYTTFTGFTGKVDYIGKENKDFPFFTLTADYYLKKYNLNIHTSAGRFLYQDEGFMMRITRQFSETSIGFFALSTTYGSNAGFQFSFALPPRRYAKPGIVRIRPEHSFALSYRVVGGDRIGRTYSTGTNMISVLPEFYPSFLLKELKNYIQTINPKTNNNK